jgi:bifunctional N-acetylglucosamine-1-phosphate-uridyltransferase/glucosamine-1-phosphate-acetyltransferase GlmU-like protein
LLINGGNATVKIVIPMTGYGSRFVLAGYKELKPFVNVQGRIIIEWIVRGMYSESDEFLFVCRKEHLDKYKSMRSRILQLSKKCEIFEIIDWVKKGPVFDVLCASDMISDDEACVVNYCDFYMVWNWEQFKNEVKNNNCDGAVPCYSGFHPHLLSIGNLYASCLSDKKENLIEIREKYSFEKDKVKARHSPGVYYFKNGKTLKKYCQKLVDNDLNLKGEYYVSLVYNLLAKDGLRVWTPINVKKFCQWGTPEDLQEYLFWTEMVRRFKSI